MPQVNDPSGKRCGKVVVMPIPIELDQARPKPSCIRGSIEIPRVSDSSDTGEKLEYLRSELQCIKDAIAILERLAVMRGLPHSDPPAQRAGGR